MFRLRPQNREKLICDICGKPAKWYDRVFHASYVLGEALCDECNDKVYKPMKEPLKEGG